MNTDRKRAFIKYCAEEEPGILTDVEQAVLAEQCFQLLRPHEAEWFLDVVEQDYRKVDEAVEEIVPLLTGEAAQSEAISLSVTKILYLYGIWCNKNRVSDSRNLRKIRNVTSALFLMKSVSSPSQLKELLDSVLLPNQLVTSDCLARGFIWLSYLGLYPSEIYSLKTKDIGRNGVLQVGEKRIKLDGDALDTVKILAKTDRFYIEHPLYNTAHSARERFDGDELFRKAKSVKQRLDLTTDEGRQIATSEPFRKFRDPKKLRLAISSYSVYASGVYYRSWQYERDNNFCSPLSSPDVSSKRRLNSEYGIPALDQFVYDFTDGKIEYIPGKQGKRDEAVKRIRRRVYREYEAWKNYFCER